MAIKVSVVVPVCNVEKYLRECLDSLLAQSLKEMEFICVDDGSKDSSPAILAEYARKDSRVKVITKPNAGYGHTMNRGIDAAAGEYIGILESDDVAPRDMFASLYEAATRQRLDLVKSDFYRFETVNDRRVLTYVPLTNDEGWYDRVICPAEEPDSLRLALNTWTGIYRREFLAENGMRHNETPGASYQDNGFFFQTMCLAKRMMFLHKAYYLNRRDNPNSSVYDKGKVYAMCGEMAFVRDFLMSRDGLWEKFKDVYYFKLLSNYEFTYNRIAQSRRKEFLEHISLEFAQAEKDGWLDMDASYTDAEAARVRIIIDAPQNYPTYGAMIKLERQVRSLESEINALKNSRSYKVGRLITAAPRRLKNFLRR
jgi:glycosyltransferase involved in cell wall biosynthesis